MITGIEDFFAKGCGRCARFDTPDCSAMIWAQGLAALRRICLGAGLVETAKWGHPCYMHAGRNVVLIGALRGDFRLVFFHAGLMADPLGILERQGPNTRHPDMIRFTDAGQPAAMEQAIGLYLAEAMGHAEAGRVMPKETGEVELPPELAEALEADAELAGAFHALTPGRRKSWVIQIGQAKQVATRIARIERARPAIMAGKGALDR